MFDKLIVRDVQLVGESDFQKFIALGSFMAIKWSVCEEYAFDLGIWALTRPFLSRNP